MFAIGLKCVNCGKIFPLNPKFFVCPKCGLEKVRGISVFRGITEILYDYEAIANSISKELFYSRPFSALRYKELLGFDKEESILTLGEGGTPLIKCEKLAKKLNLNNLWLKNETQNPTHSFKDRESFLAVNMAIRFGRRCVSCVSSGNAAASLAAYAARAGLGCCVFMPSTTSRGKISQCKVYGATVFLMDGIYEEIFELYIKVLEGLDTLESSAGHNRFRVEGDKTIAYEICEQLGWKVPTWIIDNVGNGTHLYGMWKGFKELKNLGFTEDVPKMAATGPEAGAPIVTGFKEGTVLPLATSHESIAEGLVGRWGYDAPLAVNAIKESNGYAEHVSDIEIFEAMKLLAQLEGIFAEPSGVACIAGLSKLVKAGIVKKNDDIVCIITGSGLKDPRIVRKVLKGLVRVQPTIESIRTKLQQHVDKY